MTATKEKTTQERKYPDPVVKLWKQKSKDGTKTYLSSKTHIAFYNTKKKNPNEPDLRIYIKTAEGKKGEDYASIWCNTTDAGKKYLSGKMVDGTKLTGFINDTTKNDKIPYCSIYLDAQLPKKESKKEAPKKEAPAEVVQDNDLPF